MSATHDTFENNSNYRTPHWVKVFGIVALVLVVLVIVVLATGIGGEHGPDRHIPSGSAGSDSPPSEQEAQPHDPAGHTPPVEHGA